ncbi:MAG: hypothetical protein R3F35_24740 [Myxococcota bacterium]
MAERWRRCSACKQDIPLSGVYWVCSVSTCNRARTALVFCSVDCWEIHLPTERHRTAWAVEQRAPAVPDPADGRSTAASGSAGSGTASGSAGASGRAAGGGETARAGAAIRGAGGAARRTGSVESSPTDVLVVASKLKAYIREGSGFNTSDRVLLVLSDALRRMCDEGIRSARRAGRDTVLDRDVTPP